MTKIQLRHDTAENWTSANPTLAAGEAGVETDTNKFKLGDGSTAWTDLAYAGGGSEYTLPTATANTKYSADITNDTSSNQYTITIYNEDGSQLGSQTVTYGSGYDPSSSDAYVIGNHDNLSERYWRGTIDLGKSTINGIQLARSY